MSGEAAGESGPSGLLPIGLSRTFKEAQRSCDSLVLSARQHPNLKGIVSELDRMEATIKRSAQERFSSFSQLLPTASGLDPFSQAPLGGLPPSLAQSPALKTHRTPPGLQGFAAPPLKLAWFKPALRPQGVAPPGWSWDPSRSLA